MMVDVQQRYLLHLAFQEHDDLHRRAALHETTNTHCMLDCVGMPVRLGLAVAHALTVSKNS